MRRLKDLQVGDRVRVCGYSAAGGAYRRKLLSMGLTLGVEVQYPACGRTCCKCDPNTLALFEWAEQLTREPPYINGLNIDGSGQENRV